ncbi:hypothetical protein MRX96_045115 [Rhipicephalus microplus]
MLLPRRKAGCRDQISERGVMSATCAELVTCCDSRLKSGDQATLQCVGESYRRGQTEDGVPHKRGSLVSSTVAALARVVFARASGCRRVAKRCVSLLRFKPVRTGLTPSPIVAPP